MNKYSSASYTTTFADLSAARYLLHVAHFNSQKARIARAAGKVEQARIYCTVCQHNQKLAALIYKAI